MSAYVRTEYFAQDNIDLSTSLKSDVFNVEKHMIGSVHFVWSGVDATDGAINIEGSNDKLNWQPLYDSNQIMSAASGNYIFEFYAFATRYIRLSYTANSNTTGTAYIRVVLKR